MRKASKVSGGFAVKRKARRDHECYDCRGCIEVGEQYYQLRLQQYDYGYYPKCVCKKCWRGKELEA